MHTALFELYHERAAVVLSGRTVTQSVVQRSSFCCQVTLASLAALAALAGWQAGLHLRPKSNHLHDTVGAQHIWCGLLARHSVHGDPDRPSLIQLPKW